MFGKSLTLVAITGGGLRYYLSSLSSSYITSAQASMGGGGFDYSVRPIGSSSSGLDPRLAKTRPGKKMIFCHVRAPPPYTTTPTEGNDGLRFELAPSAVNLFSRGGAGGGGGGLPPGIHNVAAGRVSGSAGGGSAAGDVVKGCYGNGVFVLALDVEKGKQPTTARGGSSASGANFFSTPSSSGGSSKTSKVLGDAIVVALPDFAARVTTTSTQSSTATGTTSSTTTTIQTVSPGGGISESILMPMSGQGGTVSPVLPGGRASDIVTTTALSSSSSSSSVMSLFMHSETPSDVELRVGLLPPFTPRKRLYKKKSSPAPSSSSSSALVVSNNDLSSGRGVISYALSALSYYIRNSAAKGSGYEVGSVAQDASFGGPSMSYRISRRYGCDTVGFSTSAGESGVAASSRMRSPSRGSTSSSSSSASPSTTSAKSARLPPWLIRPAAAPLNSEASQHLMPHSGGVGSSNDVLILNTGGLHFFAYSSLLTTLEMILQRSNSVAKDLFVRNFFTSYGYAEGCAMCFAVATSASSSSALRTKAENAAMNYGRRPVMKLNATGQSTSAASDGLHPLSAYTFQPSSLYEGLVKLTSRLLRPFLYKPAVVVTEGRPIHDLGKGMGMRRVYYYTNYYASLPAKVELLLDDITLDEVRRPLLMLVNLMKRKFIPVVQTVPGGKSASKKNVNHNAMDVDMDGSSGGGALITVAMQNQSRAAASRRMMMNGGAHPTDQIATPQEVQAAAYRTEDRNMHSLYRLMSRSVQLLNLLYCLKRAHETPSLPEVQWGLLHGLTFYQLVSCPEGQARIETLLNALVSQPEKTLVSGMSTDGDLLAETLSRECYLFFSSASRLTYLGFRAANDALSRPVTSPQRSLLVNQAASYLRSASRHCRVAPTDVCSSSATGRRSGRSRRTSTRWACTIAARWLPPMPTLPLQRSTPTSSSPTRPTTSRRGRNSSGEFAPTSWSSSPAPTSIRQRDGRSPARRSTGEPASRSSSARSRAAQPRRSSVPES